MHKFGEDDNHVHQRKHSNIGVLQPLFSSGVLLRDKSASTKRY